MCQSRCLRSSLVMCLPGLLLPIGNKARKAANHGPVPTSLFSLKQQNASELVICRRHNPRSPFKMQSDLRLEDDHPEGHWANQRGEHRAIDMLLDALFGERFPQQPDELGESFAQPAVYKGE